MKPMHCTLAALVLAAFVCLGSGCGTPSAQGKSREEISQLYQSGKISRSTYLSMVADYERLHPTENAVSPDAAPAAKPADAAATDPAMAPEKAKSKNLPIIPPEANDNSYTP